MNPWLKSFRNWENPDLLRVFLVELKRDKRDLCITDPLLSEAIQTVSDKIKKFKQGRKKRCLKLRR